jgi:hypothetical protein
VPRHQFRQLGSSNKAACNASPWLHISATPTVSEEAGRVKFFRHLLEIKTAWHEPWEQQIGSVFALQAKWVKSGLINHWCHGQNCIDVESLGGVADTMTSLDAVVLEPNAIDRILFGRLVSIGVDIMLVTSSSWNFAVIQRWNGDTRKTRFFQHLSI